MASENYNVDRNVAADMREALIGGREVKIHGVGILRVKDVDERMARNVRTGEDVVVPAGKRVKFRQSTLIKAALNGG